MQELLFEQPLIIGVGGCALVGMAVFFWLQSAHKAALFSAIGMGVVTLILVFVGIQIQTDRERIRVILDEVAGALKINDRERVYGYIHPNAVEGVQRARDELPRYEFSEARVTRVKEIVVNKSTSPHTAIAEFNVFVELSVQGQNFKVPRFVKVYFMQRDGEWLVRDYEHYEPTMGFKNTPLTSPVE